MGKPAKASISARDLGVVSAYAFERITLPLRDLDEATLLDLSRRRQLSLSLAEMRAIQAHFRDLGREPTDVELETLARRFNDKRLAVAAPDLAEIV